MGRLMTDLGIGFPDALRPLSRLRDQIERALEGRELPASGAAGLAYPAVNTWEDDGNAYVEAELPGVAMEDIGVSVTGNELTIRGERKPDQPVDADSHRRERPTGTFARTIDLPWEIQPDKVEARLQDGVLVVKLPKSESAKPRKVKVIAG